MATTLLKTKLFIPSLRTEHVSRPHLVKRLNAGLQGKLTLLSAPAGFGKTSLLSEWAAECERGVAWVSLDEGDDNPVLFMSYLIAALQRIDESIGEASLAALHAAQPSPVDASLSVLINDVAAISKPCLLILDDYHQINDQVVHDAVAFLFDHQPPHMHLVISTRADPPWPLARLRSRGEMTELRSGDLRFAPEETLTFLNGVMALDLPSEQVEKLEHRVEGWIAGLQMAALSMRGRPDAAQFINAFSGSHRFILDYLVEEVLDRQEPGVQEFMLQTSILARLSGPLCDAVTQRNDSHQMLTYLEQANLFLMPLDDERRWYRYHHLFADLLQQRLQQTRAPLLPDLHQRAIDWYEAEDLITDAVDHALAANDFQHVARIAEDNVLGMMERGEVGVLARWLKTLPDEIIHSYPWLCVACAWALAHAGRFEDSDQCLHLLEDELMPAVKAEERSHVSGHINAIRLYNASLTDSISETASRYARTALTQLPDRDVRTRGLVAVLHGIVQRMNHRYSAALENLQDALAQSKEAGEKYAIVDLYCQLARVESQQGSLRQAAATSRQAIQLAEQYGQGGQRPLPVVSYAHVSLAVILMEWNRLEEAESHVERAITLGRDWGQYDSWVGGQLLLARIYLAKGRWSDALKVIEKVKQTYDAPSDRTEATEALIRLVSGDIEYASRWSDECKLAFRQNIALPYLNEGFLLARIRIAQFQHGLIESLDDVLAYLKNIYRRLDALNGKRGCIRALATQSLALWVLDEEEPALAALSQALNLAASEGYIRTFVDAGVPIEDLLRAAAAREIAPSYVRQLLDVLDHGRGKGGKFEETEGREGQPVASAQALPPRRSISLGLVEPLSQRELEVLQLLASSLSSTEIGRELYIAPSTVRTHIKSIYSKLNVHRRVAAVTRAKDLGLL